MPNLKPIKILYIEDDVDLAQILKTRLEFGNFLVDLAYNGKEGIKKYDVGSYDVVLVDYKMPIVSGVEVIKTLSLREKQAPIIMITGIGDEKLAVEAIKSGASDYIIKDLSGRYIHLLPSVIIQILNKEELAVEKRAAEAKLRMSSKVFENTSEGIMVTDAEGIIQSINPAFTTITGYSSKEVVCKNPRILSSGRHDKAFFEQMWKSLNKTGEWQGEIWNRRKNGESFPEWLSISAIYNDKHEVEQYAALLRDITNQKKFEDRLDYLAHNDALTGLPNRFLFNDRLNMAIVHARRNKNKLAVMFLDLDRFKVINDSLGHTVGDLLLQDVAERLKGCLRKGDTVARQGGDEFIAIFVNIVKAEDAAIIAQKVLDAFSDVFEIEGNELSTTPSIGISMFPSDGKDMVDLVKNADIAMYRAKEQGRNNYQFYSPIMSSEGKKRLLMENSLRHVLKRDELSVYYQPILDIKTEKVIGVKALLRWSHHDLGTVSPSEFIPLAEETGLIVSIGEWMIRESCLQNKKWQDSGLISPSMRVVVNLSARQFNHKDLITMTSDVLKETGMKPESLEYEITESTAMQHPDVTLSRLSALKGMGVRLSIDDIGTGDSLLRWLRRFHIDTLKIDKSFLGDLSKKDNESGASLLINMARSLKLKVVAEGVETEEQLNFLRSQKCDEILGYFFSIPVPPDEFIKLLKDSKQF